MDRLTLGVYLFVGAFAVESAILMAYVVAREGGLIYTHGYGNPVWFDVGMQVSATAAFAAILLSFVLMYGGGTVDGPARLH